MASRFQRLAQRSGPFTVMAVKAYCLVSVASELTGNLQPTGGFSMMPTLHYTGDVVFFSPLAYWNFTWAGIKSIPPERGDCVVYPSPTDPSYSVIKRVIGLPGDVVEVEPRRDAVPWAGDGPSGSARRVGQKVSWGEGRFITVPKGHVWAVGDNLSNSTDSRTYGPVPIGSIKGKVISRVVHNGWFDNTDVNQRPRVVGTSPDVPPQMPRRIM